jgi:hypothetical protein
VWHVRMKKLDTVMNLACFRWHGPTAYQDWSPQRLYAGN